VKQIEQASHDCARALHTEWIKRMNADLQVAGERIEERKRALDQHAQDVFAVTVERVHSGLENSQKEAVSRIVGLLKEQVAPVMSDAKKVAADLSRNREGLEEMIDQALSKSSVRMGEICATFESQFEMILKSHLDEFCEDLQRASQDVTNLALNSFQAIAQNNESEARLRFQASLDPVSAKTLIDFKERATETSRQISDEFLDYGRNYLEFVGSSVADLAKHLGKQRK
jgi:predicted translin family RNA/ssDNA-binding protein